MRQKQLLGVVVIAPLLSLLLVAGLSAQTLQLQPKKPVVAQETVQETPTKSKSVVRPATKTTTTNSVRPAKPQPVIKVKPAASVPPASAKAVTFKPERVVPATTTKPSAARVSSLYHIVELKVGAGAVTNPNVPEGSGEFPTQFIDEASLSEEGLRQANLYMAFRYRSQALGVKGVEWQVATFAASHGVERWRYPQGLMARGRYDHRLPEPGQAGYVTIDFRPIHDLPLGYTYPRPLPPKISGKGGVQPVAAKSYELPSATTTLTPEVEARYRQKATRFEQAMSSIAARRTYYVRLVLLGEKDSVLGLSTWVTVRTSAPSQIVVYANALPSPVPAPNVVAPQIHLSRYSGPKYFSPDDRMYRFVVLGNVPKIISTTMGWKPGDKLYLKPSNDDDGWLDKVGSAVGSVFSAFEDIVNWLSETWDDLKNRLINTVCFNDAECAKYAMPVLNTGLTYLGIPPELPNFNELTSMGADYLASYVASQTLLPEEAVRMGIGKMGDLVNNPPSSSGSFLWPDPAYQDMPGVIWVEVNNPLSEPTDPVLLELKFGTLCGDACHAPPQLSTYLDTMTPIPPLRPGQKMEVPIFLTENPEIAISHGADRKSDYFGRKIIIYDGGGKVQFSSARKWYEHEVLNSL